MRVSKGSQERTFSRLNLIARLFAGGAKRGLRKGKLRFGYWLLLGTKKGLLCFRRFCVCVCIYYVTILSSTSGHLRILRIASSLLFKCILVLFVIKPLWYYNIDDETVFITFFFWNLSLLLPYLSEIIIFTYIFKISNFQLYKCIIFLS